jgi:hypothetical protein
MLTYADVCGRLQHLPGELGNLHNMTELGVADNQVTYAHVCSPMLTYADVC